MASVATLTIDLIANSGRLNRDLRKAGKDAKGWATATRNQVNVAGKAFGALGVTGAAALSAIYTQAAQSGDKLAKLSDALGEMPERVTQLQHAAELTTTGGTEMLNKSLEVMNKRMGEAKFGTGEAAKYLGELGLANEQFFALSPADKIGELAEGFAQLSDNEERSAAAAAIFGRSGTEMVNVLAAGKQGLADMAAEADQLGITMNRVDLAKIEAANDSFHKATQTTTAFGKSLATEAAPLIGALSDQFTDAAKEAGGFGQVATNVVTATAEGVGFAADAVHGLNATWKAGHLAVAEYVSFSLDNWAAMDRGITAFLNKIPGVEAKESQFLQGMAESMANESEALLEEFNELALGQMPSDKIKAWVEDVRAKAEVAAQEVAANRELNILGNVTGGDGAAAAAETDRLVAAQRDRFDRIHEEMLLAEDKVIELELFRKQRADVALEEDLERIRQKGLLTDEIEAKFRTAKEQKDKIHQKRLLKLEADKNAHLTKMGDDLINLTVSGQENMRGNIKRILLRSVADHIKAKALESEASGFAAIQQAWASAPFPANLPGVFITTAKTLATTAAINALTPSFDGGGYTGSGSRTGGLDGKGGFMAMLHPKETVIDHTKGQGMGAVVNLGITVVNELGVAANAEIEQDGEDLRVILRAVDEHLEDQVRNVKGVGAAMKQTFKLSAAGQF